MSITVKKNKQLTRITLKGEVNIYSAMELWTPLLEAVTAAKEVEIDLSNVSDLDSAGLQLLMMAKRSVSTMGKELRLVNHSQSVVDVLELLNLTGYFGDPLVIVSENGVSQ